ncbi:MAG: hypothetical protein KGJ97_06720 [Xanthomonadaceae bacterium]|jgi:hypothetical protein|nr:hypothetical protein [Xanthomonadaceae bacterium]MDE3071335.1 hypothetical protein [Pseudomonadota bacterium]
MFPPVMTACMARRKTGSIALNTSMGGFWMHPVGSFIATGIGVEHVHTNLAQRESRLLAAAGAFMASGWLVPDQLRATACPARNSIATFL